MRNLLLQDSGPEPLRVLCLGAHSDDIELGCGASLFSLLGTDRTLNVHWTVFSAEGQREEEARSSAGLILNGVKDFEVEVLGFPDGFFPSEIARIKEHFEDIKDGFDPDLVFTHRELDRHQDHRVVCELTWNTFRHHLILEYEIPKYDGDLGNPNLFIPVTDEARGEKTQLLMDVYSTQREKAWFTPETFDGLMRIRGVECASPTGYAEGFYVRKTTLDLAFPSAR